MNESCARFVGDVDAAMRAGSVAAITERVQRALQQRTRAGELRLPAELVALRPDAYARRLLHRCPDTGYTIVVMTWGPGQRTELHDHAGMWCVECVVEGALNVEQFDRVDSREGRFRFERQRVVRAGIGDAGCLIPPFEYHILGNALADRPSVSVHVYAGEMDRCNRYVDAGDGWWRPESRALSYDA
jgi:predicted metal-dependent enzyme (double-stranded beta helix superfamily)